ncbi:MAG TPA: hypothetical protein VKQ89_06265 [Candidatus Angelobacter sp.]|nr:hypothetical protein [Candidatus Angelobacter sp.]
MATAPEQVRASVETEAGRALPAAWWDGLCGWLTDNLKNVEMTLERRREDDREWKVECVSHPLESVSTHEANGVQIISITAGIDGKSRVFEFAGPHSITLFKDPAGFPVRVEIANENETLLLCFAGPIEPQTKQTSNSWGE